MRSFLLEVHWIWRVNVFLILPLLSACRYPVSPGHYEGYLHTDLQTEAQLVAFDVSYAANGLFATQKSGTIRISTPDNSFTTTLEIRAVSSKRLELSAPLINDRPFILDKKGKCFVGNPSEYVELCFAKKKKRFLLRILNSKEEEIFLLTGNAFAIEELPDFETPNILSLDAAIGIALEQNIQSKQELERVYQAKQKALFAYLELYPRPNISAYVFAALWGPQLLFPIYGALAAGDFVPFLLPNRYFHFYKAKNEFGAEEMAMQIMKADLVAQVETLAYLHEGAERIFSTYTELLGQLSSIQQSLTSLTEEDREKINLLMDSLLLEKIKAETAIHKAKFALSESLGFSNPMATQSIELPPKQLDFAASQALNADFESKITVARSFELEQVDYVIEAATFDRLQSYFGWLDLRGDPRDQLALTLSPQIKIKKSKIREMELKRTWLRDQVIKKTYEAVEVYNEALRSHLPAKRLADDAKQSLDKLIESSHCTGSLDISNLEGKVRNYVTYTVQSLMLQTGFETARIRLDRLKLGGYYKRSSSKDFER